MLKKAFDKIHQQFMIKAMMRLRTERTYCNIIKAIYANLHLTYLKSATRKGAHSLLFNKVLKFSHGNKAGRRNKRNTNR
jgi:hypothetical protein